MAEKREAPTARRLASARHQGRVAVSRTLTAFFALASAAVAVGAVAREGVSLWTALCQQAIAAAFSGEPFGLGGPAVRVADAAARVTLSVVSPAIVAGVVAAVAVGLLQTRGARTRLGHRAVERGGVVKAVGAFGSLAVGALALWAVRGDIVRAAHARAAANLLHAAGHLTLWLTLRFALASLVWATLDVVWQWWAWHRSLHMTAQDVKEEARLQEGDRLVRAERQRVGRQLAGGDRPR